MGLSAERFIANTSASRGAEKSPSPAAGVLCVKRSSKMLRKVFWCLYDVVIDVRRQIFPYKRDRSVQ